VDRVRVSSRAKLGDAHPQGACRWGEKWNAKGILFGDFQGCNGERAEKARPIPLSF